jgi:hypothetical protein
MQVPDFNQVQGEFNRSTRQDQYSKDCTLTPFSRCVEPLQAGAQGLPECHDMSCTLQKQLLIDGEPCDSSALLRSVIWTARQQHLELEC